MDTNDIPNNSSSKSRDNNNPLYHALDIVKAAFPYLDSNSQQSMDFLIKTGELIDTFHSLKNSNTVTAFSINKQEIDLEGLLTNIRNVCYEKERELIDTILNFIKAKNLFETYSAFASTMASQSGESPDLNGLFGGEGNPDMMELLDNFLTPEQKSTFENINMMFSMMQ